MPRPKKNTEPLKIQVLKPEIPAAAPLIHAEREELRTLFANPIFVKAWNNINLKKPSVIIGEAGQLAQTPQAGCNRLFEIRGWELALNSLLLQAEEPPPQRKPIEPTYPNSGVMP